MISNPKQSCKVIEKISILWAIEEYYPSNRLIIASPGLFNDNITMPKKLTCQVFTSEVPGDNIGIIDHTMICEIGCPENWGAVTCFVICSPFSRNSFASNIY